MTEFSSCAICGRTILRGERVSEYVDAEGETVGVCALCKPRAEAGGWVPAGLATTAAVEPPRRRRMQVGAGLRERLSRLADSRREPPADPDPPPSAPPAEHQPEPGPEVAPTAPRDPVEVFNDAEQAHTVAGLIRSLGEPQVTVLDDGAAAATIVVAWELSWYRWRVEGEAVSELAHGSEISELDPAEREWNASAGEDGAISRA